MTRLGEYLAKKSVNKAEVARKTGLHKTRINELANLERARLTAEELYLIAMAIDVNPCDILNYVCEGLSLRKE
ncbi:MAG: helix-turn-helix domain-containing protein [Candidatus Cyclobacteriaceae bacterium M2_1C_046]